MALSKNMLITHPFYYRILRSKLSFHQVIKFKFEFDIARKKCVIHNVMGVARIFPDVRTLFQIPLPPPPFV